MKLLLTILCATLTVSALSGCNTMKQYDIATACENGIDSLDQRLNEPSHALHQTNISRANSLLIAAQVQHEFAEYTGCVDKVKRAQDYLSGRQSAIISRL